ncbi:MAG: hypothetical protein V4582_11685 [Pseudomonadota bacterium]
MMLKLPATGTVTPATRAFFVTLANVMKAMMAHATTNATKVTSQFDAGCASRIAPRNWLFLACNASDRNKGADAAL